MKVARLFISICSAGFITVLFVTSCKSRTTVNPARTVAVQPEAKVADPGESEVVPPLWDSLEPGPFAVGYRFDLVLDPARPSFIAAPGDQRALPRPIPKATWYPANHGSGDSLDLGDYVVMTTSDAEYRDYTDLLGRHELGVIAEIAFGRPDSVGDGSLLLLTTDEKRRLDEMIDLSVMARRDAPAASGTFPTVIYHLGAGSGLADNFLLFEFLASHGYVVISSSFGSNHALDPSTAYGTLMNSFADINRLRQELARDPQVDQSHVVLMGHSFGAQTMFAYAIQEPNVDALISLDTTFETLPLAERGDAETEIFYSGLHNPIAPILLFHTERADDFSFIESLKYADRYVVQLSAMDHDDLTAYGGALQQRFGNSPSRMANRGYISMCKGILDFLTWRTQSDSESRVQWQLPELGEPSALVRYLPGEDRISRSPRDFLAALERQGNRAVERLCQLDSDCDSLIAGAVAALASRGEHIRALEIANATIELGHAGWNLQREAGGAALRSGDMAAARSHFKAALQDFVDSKPYTGAWFEHFKNQLEERIETLDEMNP